MAGTSNPRNGSTAWTSSVPCPRCHRFMNTNGDDYRCVHCGYSLVTSEEKIERFYRRGKQKRESFQRQREED